MPITKYYILWATEHKITNYGIYTSKDSLEKAIKEKGLQEYYIETIQAGKPFDITIS